MRIHLKVLAETIGVTAIVASLIFVGIQLRQDIEIAESELLTAEASADLELVRMIQERPAIWRKGLAGESLTDDERLTFDLMAYVQFRIAENRYRISLFFEGRTIGWRDPSEGLNGYPLFIHENPGLRDWFDRMVESRGYLRRSYGLPEPRFFYQIVSEQLDYLDGAELEDRVTPNFPF